MPSTDPSAPAESRTLGQDAPLDEGLAQAALAGAEGDVNTATIDTGEGTEVEIVEEQPEEPSEQEKMEVQAWWDRTDGVSRYSDAVAQYHQDTQDLELLNRYGARADGTVATNLIYLNSRQTVAMMAPADHGARWEPTPDVDLVEGDSFDPANPEDMAFQEAKRRWDVARKGFAQCLNKVVPQLASKARLQEHLEAWAQEGTHFQCACMAVYWQEEDGGRPSASTVANDTRRTEDQIRRISSSIVSNESPLESGGVNTLERDTDTLSTEAPFVDWGLYFDNKPLSDWRIDDSILGFEDREKAAWWSVDSWLTDEEVVEQFPDVTMSQLRSGEVAAYVLANGTTGANGADGGTSGWIPAQGIFYSRDGLAYYGDSDDGKTRRVGVFTRRVREIWDAVARERITIIEGLAGYASRDPFPTELKGKFPMELLCFNRRHRNVYGISDTQLQAPTQARINKLRTDEEVARDAAKPRWGMDASKLNSDPGSTILKVASVDPGTVVALDLAGEEADKAFYPLFSTNSLNPAVFDGTKLEQEMRKCAALPEQSLGVTGSADFATEVQVAAQGANIATKHRQEGMERAMQTVYDLSGRYTTWNLSPEQVAEMAGPLAARYWPANADERMRLYDSMSLEVKVAFNEEMEDAKRLDSITRFLQVAQAAGGPVDPAVIGRLAAKVLGEEELEDAIQPDPTSAARILAQSLAAGGPQGLPPEAQEALAGIVEAVMADPAVVNAMAERQLASEGAEGAPNEGAQ